MFTDANYGSVRVNRDGRVRVGGRIWQEMGGPKGVCVLGGSWEMGVGGYYWGRKREDGDVINVVGLGL